MACQGGPTAEQVKQAEKWSLAGPSERKRIRELTAAVPRLRRAERELGILLCEAYTLLEDAGLLPKASKRLKSWFSKHQDHEKDRVASEALAKLTKREIRALGLDKKPAKRKSR